MSSQNHSIKALLIRLWGHLNPRRRAQFAILLVLMVATAFAEIFSIGAVIPFLAVLTDPEPLFQHPVLQPLIEFLGISAPRELLLPLTAVFGIAALVSGGMRLLLLWASTKLSFATGADLGINIYQRTLYSAVFSACFKEQQQCDYGDLDKS